MFRDEVQHLYCSLRKCAIYWDCNVIWVRILRVYIHRILMFKFSDYSVNLFPCWINASAPWCNVLCTGITYKGELQRPTSAVLYDVRHVLCWWWFCCNSQKVCWGESKFLPRPLYSLYHPHCCHVPKNVTLTAVRHKEVLLRSFWQNLLLLPCCDVS